MLTVDDFETFHSEVHGYGPFAWQSRLLREIVDARRWPEVLDLPTGAGKTTCLDIALFALALDARGDGAPWCPRRIAMVVDRRIVVDQVAARGRKLARALATPQGNTVARVAEALKGVSRSGTEPLGVYTLRGGIPKDDGWARTPDQPVILASTVDQVGSRLLCQGYGVSRSMRPVHAGLLGNDTLILLDEVHLSQPFAETLEQLANLRKKAGAADVAPKFHYALLSATPGAATRPTFRLQPDETGPEGPLGRRLHASKRVSLLEVASREALDQAAIEQARELAQRHRTVGVVLNRVASAAEVARALRDLGSGALDVRLLTGRMRPLDRDDVLRELRPRIMTGRQRHEDDRPLIVVGTQCIEAGADFDFDAMVSEVASFDALRQRFGRVDRLGEYGRSEGVIIRDKSNKRDPVYGDALIATTKWLAAQRSGRAKSIEFGVLTAQVPPTEELPSMLAPKQQAPVLLPAYLDLWFQTSPEPVEIPELSLWLHGPTSGPADVQIIWRADLDPELLAKATSATAEAITATVAAVSPSSLEALSVPFAAAKRWLSQQPPGDIADVEGADPDSEGDDTPSHGRKALRWQGDASTLIDATGIRPGDTLVVPSRYGGIRDGCFAPEAHEVVVDLAERAALLGRGQPLLRLHPAVLDQLNLRIETEDLTQAYANLAELAESADPADPRPAWQVPWLAALARASTGVTVDGHRTWLLLRGARIAPAKLRRWFADDGDSFEDGVETTTDEEDSYHGAKSVSLAHHSSDVETFARAYAQALRLSPGLSGDLALAGWLHDIGKADPRFQLMLRGGSEIDLYKDPTPWAKSAMPVGARAARQSAQRRSGYPVGTRHEVQSLAMLEAHRHWLAQHATDAELVLYLVASHHGHCRPFAPVAPDPAPVEVRLSAHRSEHFGTVDFGATSSRNDLFTLDSPLADRFWRLIERYGWLELCWLEAIVRLADHRASEQEQEEQV